MIAREDIHNVISTCEADLIAKNEEIDALKAALAAKDEALADKDRVIEELAVMIALREQQLKTVVQDASNSAPPSPAAETKTKTTRREDGRLPHHPEPLGTPTIAER